MMNWSDLVVVKCFKDIETRLGMLETEIKTVQAKLDILINMECKRSGKLSEEQYRVLLTDEMTVREKAKRLRKSVGWVSKWKKRLHLPLHREQT